MEWKLTTRRLSKRLKRLVALAVARCVTTSSILVGRALFTVQSLLRDWEKPGMASDNQDTYGCPVCHLIYQVPVYSQSQDSRENYCPKCGSPRALHLGVLPFATSNNEGVYLIGDPEDDVLGPYQSEEEAGKEKHDKEHTGKVVYLGQKSVH
jgi:hypothetical protein